MAGPWGSHEEFLVDQALASQLALSPEQIRSIRPPFVGPAFPPRVGYDREPLTISDVLQFPAAIPDRHIYLSGNPGEFSAAPRASLGTI